MDHPFPVRTHPIKQAFGSRSNLHCTELETKWQTRELQPPGPNLPLGSVNLSSDNPRASRAILTGQDELMERLIPSCKEMELKASPPPRIHVSTKNHSNRR